MSKCFHWSPQEAIFDFTRAAGHVLVQDSSVFAQRALRDRRGSIRFMAEGYRRGEEGVLPLRMLSGPCLLRKSLQTCALSSDASEFGSNRFHENKGASKEGCEDARAEGLTSA